MAWNRRPVRRGIAAGSLVLVALAVPAYALHPGNPVGMTLTVLAFSPVAFLVGGGVAARSVAGGETRGTRVVGRDGAVTGAALGVLPAVGIAYLLWGIAKLGGGFSPVGLALTVGVVVLVPVVAGVLGGVGATATAVASRRVAGR